MIRTPQISPTLCLAIALGSVVITPRSCQGAGPLAIQGAKIITVTGDTIEQGVILIRDGRIEAVGADIKIPGEARVIDAAGKVVMPGIIDAHNAAGMSQANEQAAVVPFLSVVDSIDPIASYFEECRRNGITSAAVVPGNSTLIGGKSAIVKTAGQYVNDMIVRRDSALKLSLRPTSGSRMSQMAQLRKELDAAKKALEKGEDKDAEESSEDQHENAGDDEANDSDEDGDKEDSEADDEEGDDGESDEEEEQEQARDEGLEALKLALQGKLPVYIYCEVAMDVVAAIKLVEDYGLQPIFVLGEDCYRAAELLAKQDATVILDPRLVYWQTNPRTRRDEKIELPAIYLEAGVPFLFQVSNANARTTLGTSYFWYQAATAVKYGLPESDAVAALTLEPAKLLGIDDRVGSIEVGKEADLVILTGDPLDIASWVETTIIGGQVVYERSEDTKLERLLAPTAE